MDTILLSQAGFCFTREKLTAVICKKPHFLSFPYYGTPISFLRLASKFLIPTLETCLLSSPGQLWYWNSCRIPRAIVLPPPSLRALAFLLLRQHSSPTALQRSCLWIGLISAAKTVNSVRAVAFLCLTHRRDLKIVPVWQLNTLLNERITLLVKIFFLLIVWHC